MRDSSYKADSITEYTGESDWMGRVSTLIETLENLDQKLSRQREAFSFEGDYLVPTVFKDEIHISSSELGGCFTPSKLDIQAVSVSIVPHEYNHYLFHVCADYDGIFGIDSGANPYLEGWHGEALANYFGCDELYTSFIAVYGDKASEYYKNITGHELTKPIDMAEYFDCQLNMGYRVDPKLSPKYFMSLKGRETVSFGAYAFAVGSVNHGRLINSRVDSRKCCKVNDSSPASTLPDIRDYQEPYKSLSVSEEVNCLSPEKLDDPIYNTAFNTADIN